MTGAEESRTAVEWLAAATKQAMSTRSSSVELEEAIALGRRVAPSSNELQHALAAHHKFASGRADTLLRSAMEVDDAALLAIAIDKYAKLLPPQSAVASAARSRLTFLRASEERERRLLAEAAMLSRSHSADQHWASEGTSSGCSFADVVQGVCRLEAQGVNATAPVGKARWAALAINDDGRPPASIEEELAQAKALRLSREREMQARLLWSHWQMWQQDQMDKRDRRSTAPFHHVVSTSALPSHFDPTACAFIPLAPRQPACEVSSAERACGILAWQITFYFSNENLRADSWLTHAERLGPEGVQPVPISLFTGFPRVHQILWAFDTHADARLDLLERAMRKVPSIRLCHEPGHDIMAQRIQPLPVEFQQPRVQLPQAQPVESVPCANLPPNELTMRSTSDAGADDANSKPSHGGCALHLSGLFDQLEGGSADQAASASLLIAGLLNDCTTGTNDEDVPKSPTAVHFVDSLEAAWAAADARLATPTSVIDAVVLGSGGQSCTLTPLPPETGGAPAAESVASNAQHAREHLKSLLCVGAEVEQPTLSESRAARKPRPSFLPLWAHRVLGFQTAQVTTVAI